MNLQSFQFSFQSQRNSQQQEPSSQLSDLPSSQLPTSSQFTSTPDINDPDGVAAAAKKKKKIPRATLEQKIEVLNWHHTHSSTQQHTISHFYRQKRFGITKTSLSRWLKEESNLRKTYDSTIVENRSIKKNQLNSKYHIIDKCLEKWYEQMLFKNEAITEHELTSKWFLFRRLYYSNDLLNEEEDEVKSNGWMYHFKSRLKLRKEQILNFINSQNFPQALERARLQQSLGKYPKKDVFHMDEFIITNRVLPHGSRYQKFTLGICCNADGSEILDPMIISKYKNLDGCYTSNLDITMGIIWDYLSKLNTSLGKRKIVLVLDTLYEHCVAQELSNIDIIWFRNNELSPLKNVIKWWKLEFKNLLLKKTISDWMNHNQIDSNISNELELLQMVKVVNDDLKTKSVFIRDCWEKAEILPNYNTKNSSILATIGEKEQKFIKLWKFAQNKRIVNFNNTSNMDGILFPNEELIVNKISTEQDIVATIKLEEQEAPETSQSRLINESNGNNNSLGFSRIQWKSVDKFINNDMKGFFSTDQSGKFSNSKKAFDKFWMEYMKESMDLWVDDQSLNNNNNNPNHILPSLLNS